MTTVAQRFKEHASRMNAAGIYTAAEIPWVVTGAEDENAALAGVLAATPTTLYNMPLDELELEERLNDDTFNVTARYKLDEKNSANDETETATVNFDCSGETRHLNCALRQTHSYGTREAGGAIGWNGKTGADCEIGGVDVISAQMRETWTRIMKTGELTTAFKRRVAKLTGAVNSVPWKGWEPGEAMFLGCSFSAPRKNSAKVTVTFNFAIRLNEAQAKIGDTNIGSVRGWDYIDVNSTPKVNTVNGHSVPGVSVADIYVNQVCPYEDFKILGL